MATGDVVDNKIPGLGSNKLVVANDLAKSVFYQLIVRDDGIMNGRFADDEVKTIERWIQSGAAHDGNAIDSAQAKEDMLTLIRKKRDDDNAAGRHDGAPPSRPGRSRKRWT